MAHRGEMDGDRAAETIRSIAIYAGLARSISLEEVQEAVNGVSRMDAVMPMLDPTAYRALVYSKHSNANRELVAAFSTFRHAVEKVAEMYPEEMVAERAES